MKRQRYLLDTCICICWLRDKFDVREHINAVGFENCCISEMTVAELKVGKILGQLKGGPKYKEQPMKEFFDAITVIPVSPIIDRYADEKARLALAGNTHGRVRFANRLHRRGQEDDYGYGERGRFQEHQRYPD